MRLVKAETVSLDLCDTCLYKHGFCVTKVASMDPKWDHMGLEKAPALWMEYLWEPGLHVGEYQPQRVCPTCICLRTRAWSEKRQAARGTDCGGGDQSSVQLLFTAVSSVYTIFAARFCQIDCCGRFTTSLGGRGEVPGLTRSRGR